MVLEMIRRGRLVRKSWSSAEAKVSKLRAKGLSDYHSRETVVEEARRGASGPNERLLSRHVYSKSRAEKQLFAWLKKGKRAACQRKSTVDKKERIAYYKLWVTIQKGKMNLMTVIMNSENQSCWSQVHVTAFQGTDGYAPKSGFK